MGEGESSSVGGRFQPLWKMPATGLAVPSPVGRERGHLPAATAAAQAGGEGCFDRYTPPVRLLFLHKPLRRRPPFLNTRWVSLGAHGSSVGVFPCVCLNGFSLASMSADGLWPERAGGCRLWSWPPMGG